MTHRLFIFACAWLALFTTGCCKGCNLASDVVKEIKGPEAAVGEQLVKERVVSDKELRKKLCGVDTKELTNLVVKKNSNGNYSIEGTPVERPLAPASSATVDGGAPGKAPVNTKNVLVCVGAVFVVWDAKDGPDGTKWSIYRAHVEEVTTPGAEYKRPSADWD